MLHIEIRAKRPYDWWLYIQETYYIAPKQIHGKLISSGKLVSKYYNHRKELIDAGVIMKLKPETWTSLVQLLFQSRVRFGFLVFVFSFVCYAHWKCVII